MAGCTNGARKERDAQAGRPSSLPVFHVSALLPLKTLLGLLVAMALGTGCELDPDGPPPAAGIPQEARATIDFAAIDRAVAQTPAPAQTSMAALAQYLATGARHDAEKAYAVYRWVRDNIETDLAGIEAGTITRANQSAATVFATRKAVCEGFSQLFAELIELTGLKGTRIGGFGVMTLYDQTIPRSDYVHVWNAVAADGRWYLVDPSWQTSARWDGSHDRNFFFFTDPAQFVLRHLPYEPEWQLLDPPVEREAFWAALAE
ncbi:MAG: hypothetical protein JXR37_11440 [Kiritimatiellae bacterium]|nr:hypothetical protein [Kiritimatiellia bacterium]